MNARIASTVSTVSARSAQLFAKRARARRWAAARPVLMMVIAGAFVFLLTWLALGSGVLDVKRVDVQGVTKLSRSDVRAAVVGSVGDSMLTVDTDGLRARIAEVPGVASVEVTRAWPNGLRVHVTERRAVLAVTAPTGWKLIDDTGVPFATVMHRPKRVLPLQVSTPAEGDPATRAALAVYDALPQRVRNRVVAIAAPTPAGVRLDLRRGGTVVWGGPEDADRKASALSALLHRKAALYDVSTPGIVTTS